jgi:hypothetical protein
MNNVPTHLPYPTIEAENSYIEKTRLNSSPIKYLVNLTKAMRVQEILTSKLNKEDQLILVDKEDLLSNISWENPWHSLNLDPTYNEYESHMSYVAVLDMLERDNEAEELYAWKLGVNNQTGEEIIKSKQEIIDDLHAYAIKTRSSSYWTE